MKGLVGLVITLLVIAVLVEGFAMGAHGSSIARASSTRKSTGSSRCGLCCRGTRVTSDRSTASIATGSGASSTPTTSTRRCMRCGSRAHAPGRRAARSTPTSCRSASRPSRARPTGWSRTAAWCSPRIGTTACSCSRCGRRSRTTASPRSRPCVEVWTCARARGPMRGARARGVGEEGFGWRDPGFQPSVEEDLQIQCLRSRRNQRR